MRHLSIAILLAAVAAPAVAVPMVTHEQQISGPPATPHVTSDVAVDPRRPARVIAAADRLGGAGAGLTQLHSADGGVTWGQSALPLLVGDAFHAGPAVAWTSDGAAWSLVRGINATGTAVRLRLYRSADGGTTWSHDSTLSGAQTAVGYHALAADRSDASPFRDTSYAVWNNGRPAFVGRRLPGGGLGAPLQVSGAETTGTAFGAEIATDAQGVVHAFWPDTGSRRIYRVTSTNGGTSFSAPGAIATTFDSFDIPIPAANARAALIYLTAGTYRTSLRNVVYVAWNDLSGEPGCTGPGDAPGGNPASPCKTRIWVARSTDGGATWLAPVKVNDGPALNDQFHPRLAVDETTGAVSIVYYDTIGDPGRTLVHAYVQSSTDHGATWGPPLQVTSAPTDGTGTIFGDSNGLAATRCRLIATWTDNRAGGAEQIWAARIVDSPCRLYFNDFETGVGLSDWTVGSFSPGGGTTDWRGIQTCAAHSGRRIFRMGGTTCTANYANNRFAFAQPAGATGIAVPAGAAGTRLSFWHRRALETGFDGATLLASLDGVNYVQVPATAIVAGASYNGTIAADCAPAGAAGLAAFTGPQAAFVQSVVDLDRVCDVATGGTGGCAGRTLRIAFTEVTDCTVTDDGWFLDGVEVTMTP